MAERRLSIVQPGDGSGNQFDSGGGGGDDGGMEARFAALEAANLETRDRLIKIETRLDALASKEDLALTRAALQEAINTQTWKLVTFVCSFGTALVAATFFIAKYVQHAQ